VISILRRTKFMCALPPGVVETPGMKTGAANGIARIDSSVSLLSRVSTNFDKKFTFYLPLGENSISEKNTLAMTFYHEALHSTASNNTSWHLNPPRSRIYNATDCEGSLFEDRVYFAAAVCFPNDHYYGEPLYKRAIFCPGLCEKALTYHDETGLEVYEQRKSSLDVFSDRVIGPSQVSAGIKPGDAKLIYRRIRTMASIHKQILEESKSLTGS
jgi:hypothetical protein